MRLIAALAVFSVLIALSSGGRVVCYFLSWSVYRTGDGQFGAKDIDPSLCTHIVYAYIGLNANGTVKIIDDWDITGLGEIKNLMSLKDKNPDLKILACMGGWVEGTEIYSNVAADATLRATMVESVLGFLKLHGFDGFDLDWEYPAQRDGDIVNDPKNYITLLGELKDALHDEGYLLSVVVTPRADAIRNSYPSGQEVADNVDMINVRAFDFHGEWEDVLGQNAPLYPSHVETSNQQKILNVEASVQGWINFGADPEKLNMAICTYGRTFILVDESNDELYAPTNGTGDEGPYTAQAGVLGYNEICALYGDVKDVWDDEQKVPHKEKGDLWIGYDNEQSVQAKVELANELGLGGVMVWSLDTDDFGGQCGTKWPLLTTINKNLK